MDIITIMHMTLVTMLATSFATIFKAILEYIPDIFVSIKDLCRNRKYTCYITKSDMFDNSLGGAKYFDEDCVYIMEAILYCLSTIDLKSKSCKAKLESLGQLSRDDQTSLNNARKFIFYPKKEVMITDTLSIVYIEDQQGFGPKGNIVEKREVFIIRSTLSQTDIRRFIEDCYKKYTTRLRDISGSGGALCLKISSCKDRIMFSPYNINSNTTTFDDIYFPEKKTVLNLLERLECGELNKLGLLLYGEPGTGKTSLVKAIAKHTDRYIIDIKLLALKGDKDLEEIFFSERIITTNGISSHGENLYKTNIIPHNKRIYIFEDIDAQCDIVMARRDKLEETTNLDTLNSTIEKGMRKLCEEGKSLINNDILTLSGILNVLDGVVELAGSIVIMTTNHVDKLDPALIRHGRVNMKLHMQKMTHEDANHIIRRYYNDTVSKNVLKDKTITPADLHAYCQQNTDIKSLVKHLSSVNSLEFSENDSN